MNQVSEGSDDYEEPVKPKKVVKRPPKKSEMDKLEKKMNEILDDQTDFYYSTSNYSKTKAKAVTTITKIIIRLDELKFNFTQDHFDKFIKCCVNRKQHAFIVCQRGHKEDQIKAIQIMFNKFMPTKRQVKSLMNCIDSSIIQCNEIKSVWINILYSKKYDFNEQQIKIIKDNGLLDLTKFYENKVLTLTDIETMLENHAKNRIQNDDYIQLLKKNKITPSTKCLQLFLQK